MKGIYRNPTSYGDAEFGKYMRRAFLASAGYDKIDLERPIIGIVDTSSDFNVCHRDVPALIDAVRSGVLEAGGLPFRFPTISLNEIFVSPTTMMFRNLMAMETEEMISAQPMDGVVLIGGCDKTVPAQLMAACSANAPAVWLAAGPMRTGAWRGERLGACTDCRRLWGAYRAGELNKRDIDEIEQSLCPTGGTCMVMGTASTMACIAEALGLAAPGGASAPSGSGDRLRAGRRAGRAAVAAAKSERRPLDLLTRGSFLNAITVLGAVGGSTNAIIHLTAIARRCGITLTLDDFHETIAKTPLLVDCKPAGKNYMEDFHAAGGMAALLKTLEPLLDLSAKTVTGASLGAILKKSERPDTRQSIIRPLNDPLKPAGAIVTLKGSLAPDGAVLKAGAATKELLTHRGPAVVFESPLDVEKRIDDPALKITPDSVLVLRNGGPVAAGMPEAGCIPIPKGLARAGIKDMVRVSDVRMSGTAFGTVALHCSPEAAVGGPLAFVRDGDIIALDVDKRRLDLLVKPAELQKRRAKFKPPAKPGRGWKKLYAERVLQAHLGADLDFM